MERKNREQEKVTTDRTKETISFSLGDCFGWTAGVLVWFGWFHIWMESPELLSKRILGVARDWFSVAGSGLETVATLDIEWHASVPSGLVAGHSWAGLSRLAMHGLANGIIFQWTGNDGIADCLGRWGDGPLECHYCSHSVKAATARQ